jgi:magnesium transporter
MEHLTIDEQKRLYALIENRDAAAEVLANMSEASVREVTRGMTKDEVVDLLERMQPDDATDVVENLPDELRARVVSDLHHTDEAELAELLAWPSDTAGGLMSPLVFKMRETATCGEAIAELQRHADELENVYYLYVVDGHDRLSGVISLRSLLVHSSNTPLVSIMHRDVISVLPQHDQEEVARVVARYDLLAVPVVDNTRAILGIVTVDDIVDVIKEEAAEDMMLMAGVNEPEGRGTSTWNQARYRGGWLFATVFAGITASELVGTFQDTLKAVALLAGFLPVVMGMGGNVGVQSATMTVRGLATGRVQLGGAASFIVHEARVGLVLGMVFGAILGGYGLLRYWGEPVIGLSVGSSIIVAVTIASLVGASVPLGLAKIGVDPAVATGPFVTSGVDIIGILVYFSVARTLLAVWGL